MSQSEIFLGGEGDAYHERNRGCPANPDLINAILHCGVKPKSILEIGCGDARYLAELHGYYGGCCVGIDPSATAIAEAREKYPELNLYQDVAEGFDFTCQFDLIIYGFCLYLVDRAYLTRVVARADQMLRDKGFLAIHDFDVEYPEITSYKHKPGVNSYKMDYAKLWLANPAYQKVSKTKTGEYSALTILQKRGWDLT